MENVTDKELEATFWGDNGNPYKIYSLVFLRGQFSQDISNFHEILVN